jgi:hypothetical protein
LLTATGFQVGLKGALFFHKSILTPQEEVEVAGAVASKRTQPGSELAAALV